MSAIYNLGKYLFALPFAVFGIGHFMNAEMMASMAPGGVVMVYLTGVALIAASVSILIGKYDKLATTLLAVMLLLFVFIVHLQSAMAGDMSQLLKDTALAGASLMYAGNLAKDNSVIG